MSRAFGFVVVLVALGAGLYLYTRNVESLTTTGSGPQTTIDVAAVRNDLLAIANAERRYFASNGKYATLDELRSSGETQIPRRANYTYSVEVGDNTFKVVATYTGTDPQAPKHLSVDQAMTMSSY